MVDIKTNSLTLADLIEKLLDLEDDFPEAMNQPVLISLQDTEGILTSVDLLNDAVVLRVEVED